jgi:hypothetical protein
MPHLSSPNAGTFSGSTHPEKEYPMALPTTGVDWPVSGLNKYQAGRVRKGGLVALLGRDYAGAATDLSPGGTFGSPFAMDGFVRTDLLTTAGANNQGWYLLGALSPDGPSLTPNITLDETEILQSNEDILAEITKNSSDLAFQAYESKAATDALTNNLPFASMPDDGASGYVVGEPADADLIERQFLLIRAHKADGLREFTAIGVPRTTLSKINKRTWNKKTVDMVDVVFKRLLCPFAVNLDGSPATQFTWRSGPGWQAAGGVPSSIAAPTATPTTSGHATIQFVTPTGPDAPFTYTAQVSVDGGTTWTSATLTGSPSVSGANTTVSASGLASGSSKFRVIATGTNLASTTSAPSTAVTIT